MPALSINIKLLVIFAIMGLLLAVMGGISYFVNTKLTLGLDHMTGPVWKASNSASEGTKGVNRQLLTVERILKDGKKLYTEDLTEAKQQTQAAYDDILTTSMISADRLTEIKNKLENFNASRAAILEANEDYRNTQPLLLTNISEFRDVLNRVERIASQNILNHEMNSASEEEALEEEAEDEPPEDTASEEITADEAVDNIADSSDTDLPLSDTQDNNDEADGFFEESIAAETDEITQDTADESTQAVAENIMVAAASEPAPEISSQAQEIKETPIQDDVLEEDEEPLEDEETESAVDSDWEVVNSASSARLALMSRAYELENFLRNPDNKTALEQMETIYGDLEFAVENINEYISGDRQIRDGLQAGMTHKQALQKLLADNKAITAQSMTLFRELSSQLQTYRQHAKDLTELGATITAELTNTVNTETATLKQASNFDLMLIMGTVAFGLIIMLPIYLISKRTIITPLNKVSDQLWDIAEGEGDLTIKLSTRGDREIANLASAFNAFTGKLATTIASLQSAIQQLASTTVNITTVGNQTENAVSQQQSQIDQMAGTMAELSSSVHNVANSTETAHENALTVDKEARNGRKVVENTITTINELANKVETASAVIDDLGNKSDQISTVLEVIRNISEQTNLLALNAAIEAARAGESGRGFAVVADEVRNLAARTNDSIVEIQNTIDELQKGSQEAIKVMSHARQFAQETIEPARNAGEALERITEVVGNITSLNAMIAESAKAQSRSASEIEQNTIQIRDGATATSFSVSELSDSTSNLVSLAEQLSTLASQFRIHENTRQSSPEEPANDDNVKLI